MTTAVENKIFSQIKSFLEKNQENWFDEANTNNDKYVELQEFSTYVIQNFGKWSGETQTLETDIVEKFFKDTFNTEKLDIDTFKTSQTEHEYSPSWPDLQNKSVYNDKDINPEILKPSVVDEDGQSVSNFELVLDKTSSLLRITNGGKAIEINPNNIKAGEYKFTVSMKIDGQIVGSQPYIVTVNSAIAETSTTDKTNGTEETGKTNGTEESKEEETSSKTLSTLNLSSVNTWANGGYTGDDLTINNSDEKYTSKTLGELYNNGSCIELYSIQQTDWNNIWDNAKTILDSRLKELGNNTVNSIYNTYKKSGYNIDLNILTQAMNQVVGYYLDNITSFDTNTHKLFNSADTNMSNVVDATYNKAKESGSGITQGYDGVSYAWSSWMINYKSFVDDILAEYNSEVTDDNDCNNLQASESGNITGILTQIENGKNIATSIKKLKELGATYTLNNHGSYYYFTCTSGNNSVSITIDDGTSMNELKSCLTDGTDADDKTPSNLGGMTVKYSGIAYSGGSHGGGSTSFTDRTYTISNDDGLYGEWDTSIAERLKKIIIEKTKQTGYDYVSGITSISDISLVGTVTGEA